MKRFTLLLLLAGSLFTSMTVWADCPGCPKPDKEKVVIEQQQ